MGRKKAKAGRSGTPVLLALFLMGVIAAIHWERREILVALLGLVAIAWIIHLFRNRRIARSMVEVDKMGGHEFERFLALLFKRHGYRVKNVGASGSDFGADLLVEKKGEARAVQAKHRTGGRVGNDAVQQAIAGAVYYGCPSAMVVTNTGFTRAAKEQAKKSESIPVELWSRKELQQAMTGRL